jgi:hypothetical protein
MVGSPRAVCGLLLLALGGCRATATVGGDDGGDAGVPDFAVDLAGDDFATAPPDLACSAPPGPEICGNGCDDDRNGYVDDDDPACTTQLLVTFQSQTSALNRMILEPTPHLVVVDQNPVPAAMFAEYRRGFADAVFAALETGTDVRRIALDDGGTSDHLTAYPTRDACVFGAELVVVERSASSQLHRFKADGVTELGTVPLGAVIANACTSDGTQLYVAVHDNLGNSTFVVFDKTYTQVGPALTLPAALQTAGYVHCLDVAWSRKQGVFYGLFTATVSPNDSILSATQLYPFAFDGGVGAPIDAGTLHGVGAFVP